MRSVFTLGCTLKIKLTEVEHEREQSSPKVSANRLCITTAFAEKLLVTQFCKVCNCVFRNNFFIEKFFVKFLLDLFVIFSKRSIAVQLLSMFNYQKINADLQLRADFAL